jgi:hypothetical protein
MDSGSLQHSISLGGADNEKIWDLAHRSTVGFGACLRQQGRGKSQTGGPAGAGRESNASGPAGNPRSYCPEAGAPEGGGIEAGAPEVIYGLLTGA